MRKIKFKIEYVPLSDDRIERHKDFDKLLAAYTAHPKPSWKSRLFGNKFLVYTGGIITGAALASLLWWNANHFNEHKISAAEDSISKTEEVQKNISGENYSGINAERNSSAKNPAENADATKNSESSIDNETTTSQNENQSDELKSAPEMNPIPSGNHIPAPVKNRNEKISPLPNQTKDQEENKQALASAKKPPAKSGTKSTAKKFTRHKLPADTLVLKDESLATDVGVPLSSLPPDSSKKGVHINLPKIDLSVPINAISNAADSAGKKMDSLFTKLFEKDSSRKAKPQEEISASDLPADTSKKGVHINLPKIDLNASITALSNAADSAGEKIDSLFTKLFEKDSSKKEKPQEEIPNPPVDSFKHHYAQVTFVSPIGSEGMNGKDYVHNFSFNILQGYTGALKGVEFGGLANVEKGYVHGIQFGGLTNFAFGDVKGAQFGGLVNYGKSLRGIQVSGLVSCVSGSVRGAQISGIMNVAPDTMNGLQLGGVLNLSLANNPSVAWQIGGVANITAGDLHGTQISGVLNVANKITGTQIGLINVAKKVTGFQLGLINVADTLDGDALGLISISSNGVHTFDVFGSEILYGNVALKLGSPHIYTIFAAGAAPLTDIRLGFGIGLGGHFPMGKAFINLDGISWTIHNNTLRDWNEVNLWNQIRLMVGYQFTSGFAVYLGPTANAQVYNNIYPAIAPYTIYDHQGTTNVQGWVGFVVGLQFF